MIKRFCQAVEDVTTGVWYGLIVLWEIITDEDMKPPKGKYWDH